MKRAWIGIASVAGFATVAFGAIGSHLMAGDPHAAALIDTGSKYGLPHAVALLVLGAFADRDGASASRACGLAAWLFAAGLVLFSGGLYLLAYTGIRLFGVATPFGGTAFLAGWACLSVFAFRGAGKG